jgi:hypothetical protein
LQDKRASGIWGGEKRPYLVDKSIREEGRFLAFDYIIDKDRRLIITTAAGVVTVAEVRSKLDRLFSDPEFDPHLNELIDATRVTKMYVPVTDVFELLNRFIRAMKSRTAWVVTKSGKWVMLANMFAVYMSLHRESRVFDDIPSALAWIADADSK